MIESLERTWTVVIAKLEQERKNDCNMAFN